MRLLPVLGAAFSVTMVFLATASGQDAPLPTVTRVLVVEPSVRGLRSPVFVDPIEHALATGTFTPPTEGLVVPAPAATSADVGGAGEPRPAEARTWRAIEVGTSGRFEDRALAGGYAFATVESATRRVVMLDAAGHRHVYVSTDGAAGWEPRVGDVYESGLVRVPIVLNAGTTHLLLRGGRGGLKIGFSEAPAHVFVEERDPTLPTILHDEAAIATYLGAVQLINPSDSAQPNLGVRATLEGATSGWTRLVTLPALSVTKVPIEFPARAIAMPPPDKLKLRIELVADGTTIHERTFTVDVRSRRERHTRTFRSGIDGSVQYFAVVPPTPTRSSELPGTPLVGDAFANRSTSTELAMILSLHGASVEATSQAAAYAPKDWAWIVCPTNRRPFGFDWEDWGRLDAMEVLDTAERLFNTDPRRTYLTGHSMGGHGTWHLAVTYPGRFAAIAPSAGWPDFWSYTGAAEWPGDEPARAALRRASAPSRTLGLVDRLKDTPIYILHGDKDDNVPVSMARLMRERLSGHADLVYHEQPGAGHWWGNECVDWPALMEFLKARTLAHDPVRTDVPISAGGFKDAFRAGAVLVYATGGTPEENAWSHAKARFDSETFLYRGNASLRVMSDAEYLAQPDHASLPGVFYGSAGANRAWARCASDERIAELVKAPGLGMLAIVPRRGGAGRVGLVGGTDLAGMRLTNQLPYFVSGVAYPDWFVVEPAALLTGIRGIEAGWWDEAAK